MKARHCHCVDSTVLGLGAATGLVPTATSTWSRASGVDTRWAGGDAACRSEKAHDHVAHTHVEVKVGATHKKKRKKSYQHDYYYYLSSLLHRHVTLTDNTTHVDILIATVAQHNRRGFVHPLNGPLSGPEEHVTMSIIK